MEFLLVRFDQDRRVIVNGAPGEWRTNQLLQLQAGNYIITLAPPNDFAPPERWCVLKHTTVLDPKVLSFTSSIV